MQREHVEEEQNKIEEYTKGDRGVRENTGNTGLQGNREQAEKGTEGIEEYGSTGEHAECGIVR